VTHPLNFRGLNANGSKTVKDTDFDFDLRVSRYSYSPKNFFQKGVWPGSHDTLNFWVLNANSLKTVKATDFSFGMQQQSGRDPLNFF